MRLNSCRGVVAVTAVLSLQGCTLSRTFSRLAPAEGRPGRQPSAQRELVFSEALPTRGGGPVILTLDSASVYRLYASNASAYLSPRVASRPGPFVLGSLYGDGLVIQPRFTGEYRIFTESSQDSTVVVRVFREAGDQAEWRCIRHPGGQGCVGSALEFSWTRMGAFLLFMAVFGLEMRHLSL